MAAKEDACLPDRHPPSELVYVACVDCSLVLVVRWRNNDYYYCNCILVVNADISSPTTLKQLRLGSSACVPMISDAQSNGVSGRVCVSRFADRSAYCTDYSAICTSVPLVR